MRQYRAYFFDLYGTLVDIHTDESRPSFWSGIAAFYTAHGASYGGRELRCAYLEACSRERDRLLALSVPDTLVEPDLRLVFAQLYRQKGVQASEQLVEDTAQHFRRASTTHLRAYAGAKDLLAALRSRGAGVYLLSNAQSCFTLPELRDLDLLPAFDRIWISSDAGVQKPDPRFFRSALVELGLPAADCLMIGNDPVCDIAGAKAAGMDACYLHSPLSPRPFPEDCGADLVLRRMDLRALARLLLGRAGSFSESADNEWNKNVLLIVSETNRTERMRFR